jgi:hypothetical protein
MDYTKMTYRELEHELQKMIEEWEKKKFSLLPVLPSQVLSITDLIELVREQARREKEIK